MILTNGEIYTSYIEAANQTLRPQDERIALAFARAIEAAVLAKLSQGVSVEPAATMQTYPDGRRRVLLKGSVADCDAQWQTTHILYTATAIAAARVQALEDAAEVCAAMSPAEYATGKVDHIGVAWTASCAMEIRALKGGAA